MHTSIVTIPAYDASNEGLVIEISLTPISNGDFLVYSNGKLAQALQRNFKRIIEVMSSLKKSWGCLTSVGYVLESTHNQFLVKDSKSSSMALSIALINVCREIHGQPQVVGLTGTGILRIDGSFDNSHLGEKKYFAAKQKLNNLSHFITPKETKNLFELEHFINSL